MTYQISFIEQASPPTRILCYGALYYATGRRAQGADGDNYFAVWEFELDTRTGSVTVFSGLPLFVWADMTGRLVETENLNVG